MIDVKKKNEVFVLCDLYNDALVFHVIFMAI